MASRSASCLLNRMPAPSTEPRRSGLDRYGEGGFNRSLWRLLSRMPEDVAIVRLLVEGFVVIVADRRGWRRRPKCFHRIVTVSTGLRFRHRLERFRRDVAPRGQPVEIAHE